MRERARPKSRPCDCLLNLDWRGGRLPPPAAQPYQIRAVPLPCDLPCETRLRVPPTCAPPRLSQSPIKSAGDTGVQPVNKKGKDEKKTRFLVSDGASGGEVAPGGAGAGLARSKTVPRECTAEAATAENGNGKSKMTRPMRTPALKLDKLPATDNAPAKAAADKAAAEKAAAEKAAAEKAAADKAAAAKELTLSQAAKILERELGLEGNLKDVIHQAADQLGVERGPALVELSRQCLRELGH